MKPMARVIFVLLAVCGLPAAANGEQITVQPGAGTLARAIENARPHDQLILGAGTYSGSVIIDKPITITGKDKAHIDGEGEVSVLEVHASDVVIEGVRITGSGNSHDRIDSGVKLTEAATNAIVRNNVLEENLYGIDIHGAKNAAAICNRIIGRQDGHMNRRGNGIYVWNAPGARAEGNFIRYGRDGIFSNASKQNTFSGNRFEELRFAVHYMHTHDGVVEDNVSIGNHLGYAIMFSDRIKLLNNVSLDDRDYGIMLNYANKSDIEGNTVINGHKKCLFVYNANKNTIKDNRFDECPIGIHFTGGSARNEITSNSFVHNQTQIKFISTRHHVWQGNYWSDHAAYDVNGDGFADQVFYPNDAMDQILWTQPSAKLLMGSPAVQLIRWAQRSFPSLLPGGVVDERPLLKPRPLPDVAREWVEGRNG